MVKPILGTMTFGGQTTPVMGLEQLRYFVSNGYNEIDTARMYYFGKTEEILGDLFTQNENEFKDMIIASKLNPFKGYNENLTPENMRKQSNEVLTALKRSQTDILYLHAPDISTPIEATLATVQELYEAGRFKEFGVSNYPAWEVAYIHGYCQQRGWVLPTVYQGMYNAITRDVEKELFSCLRKLNIRFYAYNPLCGGLLTGKHQLETVLNENDPAVGTRFDARNQIYRNRYWKEEYFKAIEVIKAACTKSELNMSECSLRWLIHHSQLREGDGIILGASQMNHLIENLHAFDVKDPLPNEIIEAFDIGWGYTHSVCEKYFK